MRPRSRRVSEAITAIERDVEAAHGVAVDGVAVGDCPLTEDLEALLAAGREAAVNAAKWSGQDSVSLFVEVEPTKVSLFVRDRGRGFDPESVADDRRGISQSIRARMHRHGGTRHHPQRTRPGHRGGARHAPQREPGSEPPR